MPLFKNENILTFYRVVNDMCAKPISHVYLSNCNRYNTRNQNLTIVTHRLSVLNRSLICKPVSDWQSLPVELQNSESLFSFKRALKKKLLSKY